MHGTQVIVIHAQVADRDHVKIRPVEDSRVVGFRLFVAASRIFFETHWPNLQIGPAPEAPGLPRVQEALQRISLNFFMSWIPGSVNLAFLRIRVPPSSGH